MAVPVWVERELLEAIHARQLAEHGGARGVRDAGMLESALARTRQRFYLAPETDLPSLAAAYAFGLARNPPFEDSNRRTAAVTCELFLELNGYTLLAEDRELYPLFMALAAGELGEEELADWLREHSRPCSISEPDDRYA